MTDQITPVPIPNKILIEDQKIDILDFFVVIADNLKLLIVLPFVLGFIALGLAYILPKTYESVSVLSTDQVNQANQVNSSVVTGLVLSTNMLAVVAQKTNLAFTLSKEETFRRLRDTIKVSVGKQDKLVTLTTQGKTPESAHQFNQVILDQLFILSRPRGEQAVVLQFQLDSEKTSLAAVIALESTMAKQLASGKALSEAQGRVYADALQSKSRLSASIAQFQLRQVGLSTNDLVQSPSLPETAIKPQKAKIFIFAALGSAFVLLVFVFIRQALRNAGKNPQTAYKLQRIRQGFLMRPVKPES